MTSGNNVNISTGDLTIILSYNLQTLVFKGPKYRKHPNSIWRQVAKTQLIIPLNDHIQQLSFNRSINNSNFHFRRKKILLVIDDKTNNLKTKSTAGTIDFGRKVCDVVHIFCLITNSFFLLTSLAA